MFARIKSLPIGLLLVVCGGCVCRDCLTRCHCWPKAAQLECRQVEPQAIIPDLSLLPKNLPPEKPSGQFCELSETNAQCLAAKNSKSANLLVKEADAVATQHTCLHDGSELARE